jgi:hypothetical protein
VMMTDQVRDGSARRWRRISVSGARVLRVMKPPRARRPQQRFWRLPLPA